MIALTTEQARGIALARLCNCEATAEFGHSKATCLKAGIDSIDALINLVRAEEQAKRRLLVDNLRALVGLAEQRGRLDEYVAALAEARAALAGEPT